MNHNLLTIKSIVLICSLLFACLISGEAMAATKQKLPTPAPSTVNSPYQVQEYKGKGLNIEFRYVKQKLKNVRVMNTTKYTVKIALLDNNYILGPGDYVIIDPPSVDVIRVKQTKTLGDSTLMDTLFPDRFSYYMTFTLPQTQENKSISY